MRLTRDEWIAVGGVGIVGTLALLVAVSHSSGTSPGSSGSGGGSSSNCHRLNVTGDQGSLSLPAHITFADDALSVNFQVIQPGTVTVYTTSIELGSGGVGSWALFNLMSLSPIDQGEWHGTGGGTLGPFSLSTGAYQVWVGFNTTVAIEQWALEEVWFCPA